MIGAPAGAVHDEGFALQGDVDHATDTDWVDLFNVASGVATPKSSMPAPVTRAEFSRDYALPDTSAYATGTKDTLRIGDGVDGDAATGTSSWQCKKSNNLGPKFDIVNAYAAAIRPTSGTSAGDLIVAFGSEISSPNGDRNAGVWLLQDENSGCVAGNGNTNFAGQHRDGDVFVVSAFTNGGTKSNITVYEWEGNDATGSLVLKFASGDLDNASCTDSRIGNEPNLDRACAIANTQPVNPPWDAPDADGGDLNVNEFYEGAINLTELGLPECFSTVVANSRSSAQPGSTLHDFAFGEFETCGSLSVNKYIDVNQDGERLAPDILTTPSVGTPNPLDGWKFTVVGPDPTPGNETDGNGPTVCTGQTDATGALVCDAPGSLSNVTQGMYTVTELAQTDQTNNVGFFNTDPGPEPAATAGATAVKTAAVKRVNVGSGGATVNFGNTCFVDVTLSVNTVPTDVSGVFIYYTTTAGVGPTTTVEVPVTPSSGTATTTIADTFAIGSTISWGYGVNHGDPSEATVAAPSVSVAQADGYATCSKSASKQFDVGKVTGFKFKDINSDGSQDLDGEDNDLGTLDDEKPLAGFVFQLYVDADNDGLDASEVKASAVSDAEGNFEFTSLSPGTYKIHERSYDEGAVTIDDVSKRSPDGWKQTAPATGDREVTLLLGDSSEAADPFGNTPLSDIDITFTPQTSPASTVADIDCEDTTGTTVGSQTGSTYAADDIEIKQSTITCTIVITDP